MDDNKNFKECNCDENGYHHHHSRTEHWIKFALLLLALFIACYLATYYVMDQMRHAYYLPAAPMENIDRIVNEQDKMFEKDMGFGAFPMHDKAMMMVKSPIETYKDDHADAYKMVINLRPFNNNPKNVDVSVQDNRISVNAVGEKAGRKSDKVYSFSQSFVLPEKIDTAKVTKEKKGHNYIITMPIEDTDMDDD